MIDIEHDFVNFEFIKATFESKKMRVCTLWLLLKLDVTVRIHGEQADAIFNI